MCTRNVCGFLFNNGNGRLWGVIRCGYTQVQVVESFTADNGLTKNTSTNVQLGGSSSPGSALLHNSYVNTTANYSLFVTGDVPN